MTTIPRAPLIFEVCSWQPRQSSSTKIIEPQECGSHRLLFQWTSQAGCGIGRNPFGVLDPDTSRWPLSSKTRCATSSSGSRKSTTGGSLSRIGPGSSGAAGRSGADRVSIDADPETVRPGRDNEARQADQLAEHLKSRVRTSTSASNARRLRAERGRTESGNRFGVASIVRSMRHQPPSWAPELRAF